MFSLNDYINIRNVCCQAQSLNKEIIMIFLGINFFCMKLFTTPHSEDIIVIATLHIVAAEKHEVIFLLLIL